MAVYSGQVSIGTTTGGTILTAPTTALETSYRLCNAAGVATLWVAGTGIGDGYPLYAGGSVHLCLEPGEYIWGIASGGTADVRVLAVTGSR